MVQFSDPRDCAALLIPAFFEQELHDGRLVAPFDLVVDSDTAYWLAFPEPRRNVPKIKSFRDWIVDEIKTSSQGAGGAAISG